MKIKNKKRKAESIGLNKLLKAINNCEKDVRNAVLKEYKTL